MTDLLLLPGDGIGPEVTAQARRVAEALTPDLTIAEGPFGGISYDQHGSPLTDDTLAAAKTRAIRHAAGWSDAHRDDMYEAEQAFALDDAAQARRLHIHLTPSLLSGDPAFTCHYTPIR